MTQYKLPPEGGFDSNSQNIDDKIYDILRQSIALGVSEAATAYHEWSGGRMVSERGTEAMMNVYIARSIFAAAKDYGIIVRLEERFSEMGRNLSLMESGLPRSGRVDVAVYIKRSESLTLDLISVVETKRTVDSPSFRIDVERVCRIIDCFGAVKNGSVRKVYRASVEHHKLSGLEGSKARKKGTEESVKIFAPALKIRVEHPWDETTRRVYGETDRVICPLVIELSAS